MSIPDEEKRSFITQLFELQPTACTTKYQVGLKLAQQALEELNMGKRQSSKVKK